MGRERRRENENSRNFLNSKSPCGDKDFGSRNEKESFDRKSFRLERVIHGYLRVYSSM